MLTLSRLPAELHAEILRFVATAEHPAARVRDLIGIARTCHALYHAVFCDANDSLWRCVAVALGIPPSVTLDQVLYPGSSHLETRRWLKVVQLNLCMRAPFPPGRPTWPCRKRAVSILSPPPAACDRRTVELVIAGEGSLEHANYNTSHTSHLDGGSAVFSVSNFHGLPGQQATCVYHPTEDRADIVHSEPLTPSGWTATPLPAKVGYVMDRQPDHCIVRKILYNEKRTREWTVHSHRIDRIVSNGSLLVAVAFPGEESQNPRDIASELMCIEDTAGISKVLWRFDVSEAWQEEDAYYQYPHVKNFHMTSAHIVCLITRHPDHRLGKLTRTEFVVLDVRTGAVIRTIKVNPKMTRSIENEPNATAAFTTAFKHDFLLTDSFIISGGPGSGLFVWSYNSPDVGLLYTVPDPWELSAQNNFPRQYSNVSMSLDGRYVAATTSDQLLIFDMVEKRFSGAYNNGRKVKQRNRYVSNPQDDFPGGIWCWIRDWKPVQHEGSGGVHWCETTSSIASGGVVAYLTILPGEKVVDRSKEAYFLCAWRELYGTVSIGQWPSVLGGLAMVIFAVVLQQLWDSRWGS